MTPQLRILALNKRQEVIKRIEIINYLMEQSYRQIQIAETYQNPTLTPFGVSKYKARQKDRLYAIISKLEKSFANQLELLTEMH